MTSKEETVRLIESLELRLAKIEYQDRETLNRLGTDLRIVVRRVFGEESVYWHDLDVIRFEPRGFIANSEHYRMTGAWKQGIADLAELMRAMKTELKVFGEEQSAARRLAVPEILRGMSWEAWLAFAGLLLTAVSIGIALGQTTFVREYIGR